MIKRDRLGLVAAATVVTLATTVTFIGTGRLILLDWSFGPITPVLSPTFFGLNGGLTAGALPTLIISALNGWGATITWIPLVAAVALAFVGAARLAGGQLVGRVSAGLLYAVNPFVFNRIFAGHLMLLLAYGLLPFAVAAASRAEIAWRHAIRLALWWATLTAIDVHFAWIFGLVVVVAWARRLRRDQWGLAVVGFVGTVTAYAATSLYIVLPHLATTLPTTVGTASLDTYRTAADPHLGLFANVAGLYGFWRLGPGPLLPKDVITGWPLILVGLLLVVLVGAGSALRRPKAPSSPHTQLAVLEENDDATADLAEGRNDIVRQPPQRDLAINMILLGIGGYVLALGDQGPFGAIFRALYYHLPFFQIMREPQKFLMLLALAYAIFFGWGVDYMAAHRYFNTRTANVALTVLVAILPIAYTPTLFFGLWGQVRSTSLPADYVTANRIMGAGPGDVLALPWHLYEAYPFTEGQVVANLAPTVFSRPVISGDNVQAGPVDTQSTSPRSSYVQHVIEVGPSRHDVGRLLAPLGVKYVVLSKTVDWTTYSWLSAQHDLRRAFDSPNLVVWLNLNYGGTARFFTAPVAVNSFSAYLRRADHGRSLNNVVTSPIPATDARATSTARAVVTKVSPVAYRVTASRAGWISLSEPYLPGWEVDGRAARSSIAGTLIVAVPRGTSTVTFTPWRAARLGYQLSLAFLLILAALLYAPVLRRELGVH